MNTTTTKIAGEAMTDEQIKDLAKQHYAMYDHWQIDLVGFARALLASKPAVPQTLSDGAQYFARYLIDNCENEVIREESVQAWLGKMLASPRYHPTAPAQSCGDAEQADAPKAESHVVFITDRSQSIDDVLPQDRRWVISKAIGLVAGYRNCKASETKEAMQEFVDYLRSALADAAVPRASEQADEAVTGGAVDSGHVDALEWHWSNSDEGPMYACGTDDVTESLAHALYESGIGTFGEDQTSIFLCRFRPLKIDWKHHAEWLLEHIDDTVIDHVAEDAVPTEKTDVDALSTALASVVKVDANVAYDQCEFAPGDEKYETALLRVRNDAARAKDRS
jgi:hypothetical protein